VELLLGWLVSEESLMLEIGRPAWKFFSEMLGWSLAIGVIRGDGPVLVRSLVN
jgi:hypothetical protein